MHEVTIRNGKLYVPRSAEGVLGPCTVNASAAFAISDGTDVLLDKLANHFRQEKIQVIACASSIADPQAHGAPDGIDSDDIQALLKNALDKAHLS